MSHVALVTARDAVALDEDLPALAAALADVGVSSSLVPWDDTQVDWTSFDGAVIRSPWDYVARRDEFCDWAERVAAVTPLWNSPAVVRWNTDKVYLSELAGAGIAVVPTVYSMPGDNERFLDLPAVEFVVKPTIGAGSRDAFRFRAGDDRALAHVASLRAGGRTAMIQPYLSAVDDVGETAMVYVDGDFCHAMRKGPLLTLDAEPVAGLFAEEDLQPRTPTSAERAVADRVIAWARERLGPLLYARVDLVPGPGGLPLVLELELCEPSLFLPHHIDAAVRLAAAIVTRMAEAGSDVTAASAPR